MADTETKPEEKKPEVFEPVKVKAKVKDNPARGAVTVEHKEYGVFNVVTAFDIDPPKVGEEIDVQVNSVGGRVVEGKGVNVVEYAVHVREKKK